MKRPLVLLAAVFAAASAALIFVPSLFWWLAGSGAAAAAFCLCGLFSAEARSRAAVVCGALLLACAASALFSFGAAPLHSLDQKSASVRMTVLAWSEEPSYSTLTLYGEVETPLGWRRAKVTAFSGEPADWQVGDRVEGRLRFSLPREGTGRRILYASGCALNGWVEQLSPLSEEVPLPTGLSVWGACVNDALRSSLIRFLPEENSQLLASVLLGGSGSLPQQTAEDMRRSGVGHILVVSGLHLSLLCGMALTLLSGAGLPPRACAAAGLLVCLGVMTVAGFTPSVTRAGVMLTVMLLAQLSRRRSDPFSALAAAVVVIGCRNPYVLLSWGFLLSAGSVLSILLFMPPLRRRLLALRRHRFPQAEWADPLLELLALCLGVSVYAYPMQALMFGGLPLYGLAGNLLIAPMAGVLLGFGGAVGVLGALGFTGLAAAAAVPADWAATLCRRLAALLACLPGSWQPLEFLWQKIWLVGAAALLTLAVLLRRRRQLRLPLAASVLALTLLLGLAGQTLLQRNALTLYTFEDSGSLLILADDRAVLVDADKEGAAHAERLARHQLLYTFGGGTGQAAALVLQQHLPRAAVLPPETAREIHSYLPDRITLLEPDAGVQLGETLSLRFDRGCTLVEWKGLRVLKLLPGYVIIQKETSAPADLLVDEGGMIHTPEGQTRTYRLLAR